jgi:hypothetical protein
MEPDPGANELQIAVVLDAFDREQLGAPELARRGAAVLDPADVAGDELAAVLAPQLLVVGVAEVQVDAP